MNRTAINPAIVIEVVHHHWPDFDTWRHLEKLSTLHHIVAFYFVTEGLPKDTLASRSSSFESSNEILITSYLRGGDFFTEGKKIARTGDPRVDYEKFDRTAKMAAEKSFEAERKKQKKP
jgi:hypothetical protein